MRGKTNASGGNGGGEVHGDLVQFIASGIIEKGDFVNIAYDKMSNTLASITPYYDGMGFGKNIGNYAVGRIGRLTNPTGEIFLVDGQFNKTATFSCLPCYSNPDNIIRLGEKRVYVVTQSGYRQALTLLAIEPNDAMTELVQKQSVTLLPYDSRNDVVLDSIYPIGNEKAIVKYHSGSGTSSSVRYYRTIEKRSDGTYFVSSAFEVDSSSVVNKYYGVAYQIDNTYSAEVYGNSIRKFAIDNYETTTLTKTLDTSVEFSCRVRDNIIAYVSGNNIILYNLDTMSRVTQMTYAKASGETILDIVNYDENCFVLATSKNLVSFVFDGTNVSQRNKISNTSSSKCKLTTSNGDLLTLQTDPTTINKFYVDDNYIFSTEAKNTVKKYNGMNEPIGFSKESAFNGEKVKVYIPKV